MIDKKEIILQSAMKLFAEKGYHLTSMQEIAEQANVAKGTLYTYFQSKDDLLYSILEKYYQIFSERIAEVEREPLHPKEKFFQQIYVQLLELMKYKDFILVHMREQMLPVNQNIQQFILKMYKENMNWMQQKIIEVYGEKYEPYSLDLSIMFSALLKEYFSLNLFHQMNIDIKQICQFVFQRLDDLVKGSITTEKPFIAEFRQMYTHDIVTVYENEEIFDIITSFRENIQRAKMELPTKERLLETLEMLLLEVKKPKPNNVIISSLVLFLQHECTNELANHWSELEVWLRKNNFINK